MFKKSCRIKNFPISFLAIVLGLAGFSLAIQKMEELFKVESLFSPWISLFTALVFLTIGFLYLVKMIYHFKEVKKEYKNPIKLNFYPIIAKVFLIFSIILLGYNLIYFSKILWMIGASLQFIFTILILSVWMHKDKFQIKHINPALFIPIVGNIIVPIAGVTHFNNELSWFFFSVGMILWLIFMVIIFYRIVFHDPLPRKLIPTFFILMAPPAIGFISYIKLTGSLDSFARILYYFSVFLFLLLISQWKQFIKLKFYLSSWAYSFPLSAFTIATYLMYHLQPEYIFFKYFTILNIILLSIIIFYLCIRTMIAIKNKEICVIEE